MQINERIKIGTRKSKLALWQANTLKTAIENLGLRAELVLIETTGDLDKNTELNHFAQTGIFTKALDIALLNNEVNLAIHSLKDYPTIPQNGLMISSVGERENPVDVIVKSNTDKNVNNSKWNIATGSIRRKAQWKYKFPNTQFYDLRGNVPTRLKKLSNSNWDGIIMAFAGMERLGMISEHCVELNWMIPAPGQGALGISFRQGDAFVEKIVNHLQIPEVELCVQVERLLLNKLEGGCSAPIGALAVIREDQLFLKASLHDPNGKEAIYLKKEVQKDKAIQNVGDWAKEILEAGGNKIMNKINFS